MLLAYRDQSELDCLLDAFRATDSRFSPAGRTPLLSLIVTSLYTTLEFHSPCDQEWQLDLHVAGYLIYSSKPVVLFVHGSKLVPKSNAAR